MAQSMLLSNLIDDKGTLGSAQKIGPSSGGGGGTDANAVHYTADTGKTDAQKAQARANIGAVSIDEAGDELPTVAASDTGKFLRVVSGTWSAATVPSAEANSF